jgi:hypothetical protein
MIAILVDSLHAQRAGNLIINHRHSEAIGNGDAEVSGFKDDHDHPPQMAKHDEAACVGLSATPKALSLSDIGCVTYQPSVHLLVELV